MSDKGPWNDPDILKRVHNGEAKCTAKNLFFLGTDEKIISEDEILYPKGDAFVECDDKRVTSVKIPTGRIEHPQLSPIREEVPNSYGSFDSSYEGNDYVPMVDKVVDASWNKDLLDEKLSIYKGIHDIVDASKNKDDGKSPMFSGMMALVMGIVAILRVSRNMPKKLMGAGNYPVCSADSKVKNGANKLPAISPMEYSSVLKRLGDLEKLSTLIKKPNEMPFEKEEKLNSAVSRIEMLEAELLATNKNPFAGEWIDGGC